MINFDPNLHVPVKYLTETPLRFSDVDRYGHVSTIRYPDFVFTHRFDYIREHFGIAPEEFAKKGIGFYTTRMDVRFRSPISAVENTVVIESFVSFLEDAKFTVRFVVRSPKREDANAEGDINFRVIDLTQQTPFPCPEWLFDCFFTRKA